MAPTRETEPKRTRWPRRALIGVVCVALFLGSVSWPLPALGRWLEVDDPLSSAQAIVVFGGHLPFRAMEAASIYRQGWAREVWLTEGGIFPEDLALERLGIDKPPESSYSQQVLERLGVPANSIRLIAGHNVNTADEVRTVARELKARGGDRVILITSKFHTRRVKFLWYKLIGNRPEAIVRYTPYDTFQPDRWWRNAADASSVAHEWFGLLNAWAGFPINSEPR